MCAVLKVKPVAFYFLADGKTVSRLMATFRDQTLGAATKPFHVLYLIKFHQDDGAEDKDDGGDQKEDGVQVDPSLIPEVVKTR